MLYCATEPDCLPPQLAACILLTITYPETYPDTAPMLALSSPPNTRPHPLFDLRTSSDALLSSLDPIITESLGIAMVFTLISALKENAEAIMVEEALARQADRDREASKAEEEENRKFHGERVTRESFLRWRERFMKEKEEEQRKAEEVEMEKGRKIVKGEDKLTGKELWERGLAGRGEDEDMAADSIEALKLVE